MHAAGGNGDAVSLEIQPEPCDYIHAFRRRFWRSLAWLVLLGAALALLPVMRASHLRAEIASGAWDALGSAAVAFLGVALFLAFTVELLARSFARYALRKAPAALERRVVTLTEAGVGTPSNPVPWSDFANAIETRSAFQLQLHTGGYMLLPHRQISSAAEIRRILRRHLGKRAKLR